MCIRDSVETIKGLVSIGSIVDGFEKVIGALRGRPFTSFWVAALLTSLLTAKIEDPGRNFEIATLYKSGQRDDVAQQSALLFSKPLAIFADVLDEKTRDKLIRLAKRGLSVRAEEIGIDEAAMEICRRIILALEGILDPDEVAYHIARFTYAQSDISLEKGVGLTHRDVNNIIEAIWVVKKRVETGS